MKNIKITYWITTSLIFIMEGIMPAITVNSEMAKEGIKHLGYPDYFGPMLTAFKVIGAIVLIIPQVSKRVKEWAYAGFAIDFIAASISIGATDGISGMTFFPIIILGVLITSYITFHKLQSQNLN